MKIHVNQDCINRGQPFRPASCPIAEAIWTQIEGVSGVAVRGTIIGFDYNNKRHVFTLSRKARQFVRDFDDHKPVKPISIILPYFSNAPTRRTQMHNRRNLLRHPARESATKTTHARSLWHSNAQLTRYGAYP